jgi:hypothetical protein
LVGGKRKPKPMIKSMNLLSSHAVKQQKVIREEIQIITEKNPNMYATNEADCPVQTLRKYLSKRNPTTDDFFSDRDLTWYTSRPIGGKC